MRRLSRHVIFALVALTFTAPLGAQPGPYGAATPQEVVAGMQRAIAARNTPTAVRLISPEGRGQLATMLIQPILMALRFSNPDQPMPGSPAPSKNELAAKRKAYKAAVDAATKALKPHGLDSIVGKAPMAPEVAQTVSAAMPKTDTVVLLTALMDTTKVMGTLLGLNPDEGLPLPPIGSVTGYKVSGNKATAKEGKETLDFIRIDGRWYLTPPPGK